MKRSLLIALALAMVLFVIPFALLVVGVLLSELHTIKFKPREIMPEGWKVKDIAAHYAPIILQETPEKILPPHYDSMCAIDFDGDWNTQNNLASLEADKTGDSLKPTIYYAVMETKTHFAIVYSIYHPLDWSYEDQRVCRWYENDIKNLQILIKKENQNTLQGNIWVVALQRNQSVDFYKTTDAYLVEKEAQFSPIAPFLVDEKCKPSPDATHPVLVVTSGRHVLFMPDERPELFYNLQNLELVHGIIYLPGLSTGLCTGRSPCVDYSLTPLTELWDAEEKIQHASSFLYFRYQDEQIFLEQVPMLLTSNELEGIKSTAPNPHMLPFALGKGVNSKSQGTFFFNPVAAYQTNFFVHDWSLQYLYHPYACGFYR
jgi:hypothetical protein